jgi:colanic acid/amylovoran biosynthesis glycosyltransferase
MKTVVIFRGELLRLSETFVQAQAGALKNFVPRFAGIERVENGIPTPADSILVMRDRSMAERLRGAMFRRGGFAPRFYRQLRGIAPSLIHAHFAPDAAVALPLAAALRVPLIATLHGYDVTTADQYLARGAGGRLFLKRRRELWEKASCFICVSKFIRDKAIQAGFPESKLLVHYIGIDTKRFAGVPVERERGLVLFVGRLVEKKGCQYAIEAMQIVQRNCPQASLVVIGDGPLRRSLEETARERGVTCRFLGPQPSGVVRDWMARSSVFCLPSVTAANGDSEGLPIVLAEAQAMGVPVVGSIHAGIPEAVEHGVTGLLAEERDTQRLAEHIERFLTDEDFWRAASERAGVGVRKYFDLQIQTGYLEEIYQGVLTPATDR